MTSAQEYLMDLHGYQSVPGYRLGGKGPAIRALAGRIKVLFPTLPEGDKAVFLDTVSRGRFNIDTGLWAMFLDAVGTTMPVAGAPAPVPAPVPAAPATTNKVAGEILDNTQKTNAILLDLIGMVSDLRKQLEALRKPTTKRRAKDAFLELPPF